MADDTIRRTKFLEHGHADFAGERTLALPITILRAKSDRGSVEFLAQRFKVDERRQQRDRSPRDQRLAFRHKSLRILPCLCGRLMHLPIARKKRTAMLHAAACVRKAAMPGSSLPSKYSRVAPPPVEIWVILSAKPSLCAAAAESPPPTTESAPESTIACPTSSVPAANASYSKTPMGPFHKIVFASKITPR